MSKILDTPVGWVIEYPEFSDLADQQMHTFWPWDEPEVENDIQDVRVHMTEAEQHGLITVLKLFTLYEMFAGDDYWAGFVMDKFKRPEIQRMASLFSAVEFNSHAPFYNKINELLYLDTEEFYSDAVQDPVMKDRMDFINKYVSNTEDIPLSLGAFSFIEGAVLYSSFAFIKHFQAQECGKDKIKNICRGINLSVADENTHAVGSALLYRHLYNDLSKDEQIRYDEQMIGIAEAVQDHEFAIIDRIFEKGEIQGITAQQMKDFVKHRVQLCLSNLGVVVYTEEELDNFVATWFYTNINSVQFHDFFTGSGSEYHIDWDEQTFGEVW